MKPVGPYGELADISAAVLEAVDEVDLVELERILAGLSRQQLHDVTVRFAWDVVRTSNALGRHIRGGCSLAAG